MNKKELIAQVERAANTLTELLMQRSEEHATEVELEKLVRERNNWKLIANILERAI